MAGLSIGSRLALLAAGGSLVGIGVSTAYYFSLLDANEKKNLGTCGLPAGRAIQMYWVGVVMAILGILIFFYALWQLFFQGQKKGVPAFLASDQPIGAAYRAA